MDIWGTPGNWTPINTLAPLSYHRYSNEFIYFNAGLLNNFYNNVEVITDLRAVISDPDDMTHTDPSLFIKQCDYDQKEFPLNTRSFSGKREAKEGNDNTLTVFPNPTNRVAEIVWKTEEKHDVLIIEIFSAFGHRKYFSNADLPDGHITVNIQFLPKGVYRIVLKSNSKVLSTQTLVIE